MRLVFPNVTMDKMLECFLPENVPKWNEGGGFKVVQELPEEKAYIVYTQSPKVVMVDVRQFISKLNIKKGYHLNDDGSEASHIQVRVPGGEHPDYPLKAKGFCRGIEHCVG